MANSKRRCRNCKKYSLATEGKLINGGFYCDVNCASEYGFKNRDKGAKIKHRERKKDLRINDIKIRKTAAKKACHDYIRERDKNKPCICCGEPLGDNFHAGHWLESGNNPQIRYDENNIHGQRIYCNTYKGGDSGNYKERLIEKIGLEAVNELLSKKGGAMKRTAQDYLDIERYYKEKLSEIKSA